MLCSQHSESTRLKYTSLSAFSLVVNEENGLWTLLWQETAFANCQVRLHSQFFLPLLLRRFIINCPHVQWDISLIIWVRGVFNKKPETDLENSLDTSHLDRDNSCLHIRFKQVSLYMPHQHDPHTSLWFLSTFKPLNYYTKYLVYSHI